MNYYRDIMRRKRRGPFRFARQVRTGSGRLDVALDRTDPDTWLFQFIVFDQTNTPMLADVYTHGRRLQIAGRAGRTKISPKLAWAMFEAIRKVDRGT